MAEPFGVHHRPRADHGVPGRKWKTELDYVLRKQLWAYTDDRIAVTFQYEWRDAGGQWWRSHGNEMWQFDDGGYMTSRDASINDVPIDEIDRRLATVG